MKIKYTKLTIKFDNSGEGKARFSFKLWIEKEDLEEIPEIYLLMCNRENPVSLEMIDKIYNRYLIKEEFRKAAGIEDTEEKEKYERFTLENITKFEEDMDLKGKRILNPKVISVDIIKPKLLIDRIPKHMIKNEDILLRIQPIDKETAEEIINHNLEENVRIEFQFRVFLRNFLPRETLESWESSSGSWSVDVDIHKERGYEDISEEFKEILKYPENLDLWINIPHNHLFIASSPIYKNAIKLKVEDIQYKTYETYEKGEEFFKKFETEVGDYSVQINNKEGKPKDFSIICVSPFLPEETPRRLRKDIKDFKRKSKEFVTWRGIIGPFALLVASMSMIISATVAFLTGGEYVFQNRVTTILFESFFYALFIWTFIGFINIAFSLIVKLLKNLDISVLKDREWFFLFIFVFISKVLYNLINP